MSFNTETLLGALAKLELFQPFLLNLLFSGQVNFETEYIDFDEILEDEQLAPFCSPMIQGKARRAEGQFMKRFKPAYIKEKEAVNPNRVLVRRAGEPLGGTMTNEQRSNAIVGDILYSQDKRIRRRWEWMAAELLKTGKIIVEGDDYPRVEVDFGRDADKTVALAGGAQWDQGTATPAQDLQDWMGRLDAPCTHIIMGTKALNLFGASDEGKNLLDTRRGSDTKIEMAPTEQLAAFRGRLGEGGPEVWTYSGYYKDSAGAKQLFIGEYDVLVVSVAAAGVRTFGAIRDKRAGYRALEVFPKMWENEDPSEEYIMSQSAPLPVLRRINATLCATVKV